VQIHGFGDAGKVVELKTLTFQIPSEVFRIKLMIPKVVLSKVFFIPDDSAVVSAIECNFVRIHRKIGCDEVGDISCLTS